VEKSFTSTASLFVVVVSIEKQPIIMSCCGGDNSGPSAQPQTQALPYKYLFKYIIVGDTGNVV